jgi:hypothetical protein
MIVDYEDNILYVDYVKMKHKLTLYNNKSSRIRLHLGQMLPDNKFDISIDTIKNLPIEAETRIREYIRTIF